MSASVPVKDQLLNGKDLALALGLKSPWVIRAVKKANQMLASQGREELIFTGRYSTPAKISRWLEEHQGFVARQTLAPSRSIPARHDYASWPSCPA